MLIDSAKELRKGLLIVLTTAAQGSMVYANQNCVYLTRSSAQVCESGSGPTAIRMHYHRADIQLCHQGWMYRCTDTGWVSVGACRPPLSSELPTAESFESTSMPGCPDPGPVAQAAEQSKPDAVRAETDVGAHPEDVGTASCARGASRTVEVHYLGEPGQAPCEVVQTKDGERASLWRASSDVGYCHAQFEQYLEKLNGYGLDCRVSAEDKPGSVDAASGEQELKPDSGAEPATADRHENTKQEPRSAEPVEGAEGCEPCARSRQTCLAELKASEGQNMCVEDKSVPSDLYMDECVMKCEVMYPCLLDCSPWNA